MNLGIDLVENKRFITYIDDLRKLERILSAKEISQVLSFTSRTRQLEYIASRFAAKEALYKVGLRFNFNEVSILNDKEGKPYVDGLNENQILISISHTKDYSTAIVILNEKHESNIKNT